MRGLVAIIHNNATVNEALEMANDLAGAKLE